MTIPQPAQAMSVEDYATWCAFAAAALNRMCAGEGAHMVAARDERYDEKNWLFIVTTNAADFADAMLAEAIKRRGAA